MAFTMRDDVPPAASVQSEHGTPYYCDAAGLLWYQPEGHDLWCCRGETSDEFRQRLARNAELRRLLASYPEARPFGPIDERLLTPLTDYEKRKGFAVRHSPVFDTYLSVPKDWVCGYAGTPYFKRFPKGQPSAEFFACNLDIHKNSWVMLPVEDWEFELRCRFRSQRRQQVLYPTAADNIHSLFGKLYAMAVHSGPDYGRVVRQQRLALGSFSWTPLEDILQPQFAKTRPEELAATREAMLFDNDLGLDYWVLPPDDKELPQAPRYRLFYADHTKCYQDAAGVWHWTTDVPLPNHLAASYQHWSHANTDAQQLHAFLSQLAMWRIEKARPLLELSPNDCPPYQVCETAEGIVFFLDHTNEMYIWQVVANNGRGTEYREWRHVQQTRTLGDCQEWHALQRPEFNAPKTRIAVSPIVDDKCKTSRPQQLNGRPEQSGPAHPSAADSNRVNPSSPRSNSDKLPPDRVAAPPQPRFDASRFSRLDLPEDESDD